MAALIAWLPIVRVDELVKDRRPPISAFTRVFDALWAAALRAVLDKFINTNRNAVHAIKAAFWAHLERMIAAGANNKDKKKTPAVTPGF
jgi:hypothetical protein